MSGVYIKGMQMPTEGTVLVIYKINGKFFAGQSLCPLVSVPDHGRLGDLDELENRIKSWMQTNRRAMTEDVEPYVVAVLKGIQETPTIIPEDKEDGE